MIDTAPMLLAVGPYEGVGLRCVPDVLTPAEMLDLAWAWQPGLLARLALARLLPTLRNRDDLRATARRLAQRRGLTARIESASILRNIRLNRRPTAMHPSPPGGPRSCSPPARTLPASPATR